MTGDEFMKWVAGWVLDGDPVTLEGFYAEDFDIGTEYDMETDEVFTNYRTIVMEARRLIGLTDA